MLGWWIIAHLRDRLPTVVVLLAAVGGALAMAYAVNRWVERPWSGRLRRRVERELRRPVDPANEGADQDDETHSPASRDPAAGWRPVS